MSPLNALLRPFLRSVLLCLALLPQAACTVENAPPGDVNFGRDEAANARLFMTGGQWKAEMLMARELAERHGLAEAYRALGRDWRAMRSRFAGSVAIVPARRLFARAAYLAADHAALLEAGRSRADARPASEGLSPEAGDMARRLALHAEGGRRHVSPEAVMAETAARIGLTRAQLELLARRLTAMARSGQRG